MVFGRYARYYDVIYQRKDYRKECRFLKSVFSRYGRRPTRQVLDIGCGTGNHLIPLARAGFAMTGVDGSSGMLKFAADKLAAEKIKARLVRSKMQSFRIGRRFDAVIGMFSVIDYLTRDRDLRALFARVREHLKPGGLFVFDFWQRSAAEARYAPARRGVFSHNGFSVERKSRTRVDRRRRTCTIDYTVAVREDGQRPEQFKERHVVRYFDVEEMEVFCREAGLDVVKTGPFLNLRAPVRSGAWDISMIARKRAAR